MERKEFGRAGNRSDKQECSSEKDRKGAKQKDEETDESTTSEERTRRKDVQ